MQFYINIPFTQFQREFADKSTITSTSCCNHSDNYLPEFYPPFFWSRIRKGFYHSYNSSCPHVAGRDTIIWCDALCRQWKRTKQKEQSSLLSSLVKRDKAVFWSVKRVVQILTWPSLEFSTDSVSLSLLSPFEKSTRFTFILAPPSPPLAECSEDEQSALVGGFEGSLRISD